MAAWRPVLQAAGNLGKETKEMPANTPASAMGPEGPGSLIAALADAWAAAAEAAAVVTGTDAAVKAAIAAAAAARTEAARADAAVDEARAALAAAQGWRPGT
jgi:hypothetical protein